MTKFNNWDDVRTLDVHANGDGVYFAIQHQGMANGSFLSKPDDAPAVAAAVLEAAGVKPAVDIEVANVSGFLEYTNPAAVEEGLSWALWNLKRALAIREFHAKPRVSEKAVDVVARAISEAPVPIDGDSHWTSDIANWRTMARWGLQAALDSGVLQVPADNKEGE